MNLYYYMILHTCSYLLTVSVFIKCYASLLRNLMEHSKHMHLIKIAHAFLKTHADSLLFCQEPITASEWIHVNPVHTILQDLF